MSLGTGIRFETSFATIPYGSYARHGREGGATSTWSRPAWADITFRKGSEPLAFFEGIDLRVEPKPYSQEEWNSAGPGDFLYGEVRKKGIVISD